VVSVADIDELRRMRNGCADLYRKTGYRCNYVVTRQPDKTLKVFLELSTRDQEITSDQRPRRPAANGIRPRIRKLPTGTRV
jgi:hypothetical protein